jgi:hypothetical protein
MALLSSLHEKGIRAILLPGGRIKLSPKEKITSDIREQIKRHREELQEELIKNMDYEELCQAFTEELKEDIRQDNSKGILVKLNFLDEDAALTTPEHFEELKKEGIVAYLPEEIINLLVVKSPQALKTIHEIKQVFDGKIKCPHVRIAEGAINE